MQDRKHLSEFCANKAQCGAMASLDCDTVAPLSPFLRQHVLAARRCSTAPAHAGRPARDSPPAIPPIGLAQPCKVLMHEVVSARRQRRLAGAALWQAQLESGTFSDTQLEMLRHAFVLLCGGDGPEHILPFSKLHELLVMADCDVTEPTITQLMDKLVRSSSQCDLVVYRPQQCWCAGLSAHPGHVAATLLSAAPSVTSSLQRADSVERQALGRQPAL